MSADINSVSNDSHIDQDLTTDNDLHEKHLSDSDDSDSQGWRSWGAAGL